MEDLARKSADEMRGSEKRPVVVILDDVRSMHNVGSVFRTCDAFAVEAVYLCGYTPQPPHRDIHKTALGATETVRWQHFTTVMDAVKHSKELGYKVLAVEQAHNSQSLQDMNYDGERLALLFGNEVAGVNEDALKAADGCLEIPQWGSKHSLNISVSVGVVLWEIVRNI
ncbi:MAG: RNA methyltransferase [Taibaiella sp.]|nr:RNA methyltransferase [Taibaiella sp.]